MTNCLSHDMALIETEWVEDQGIDAKIITNTYFRNYRVQGRSAFVAVQKFHVKT
jgi:hypothetical protein